jgi:hypothetical protein
MYHRHDEEEFDTEVISIFVVRTIGAWGFLAGLLLFLSGERRWVGPSYDILEVLPGSPYTWGLLISFAGLMVVLGSLKQNRFMRNFGLYFIAVWCLFFSVGLVIAAFANGTVSFNLASTYFLVGTLSIFMTRVKLA